MSVVSIPRWIELRYDASDPHRPTVRTVRGWCRDGRIYPTPRKEGRAFMLDPRAVPVDPDDPASIRAAKAEYNDAKAA